MLMALWRIRAECCSLEAVASIILDILSLLFLFQVNQNLIKGLGFVAKSFCFPFGLLRRMHTSLKISSLLLRTLKCLNFGIQACNETSKTEWSVSVSVSQLFRRFITRWPALACWRWITQPKLNKVPIDELVSLMPKKHAAEIYSRWREKFSCVCDFV